MSLGARIHHDVVGVPLLPIVQSLGLRGIPVDIERKLALTDRVVRELEGLDTELLTHGLGDAGSSQKLARDLLKLGVPLTKKTKGGSQHVTDLDVLRRIDHLYNKVDEHVRFPFLPPLIKRKKLEKARANLESLIPCHDARVRTSLRSTGTATHRYSSSRLRWCPICLAPMHGTNLQNVAKNDEETGVSLREIFVAPPGWRLIEWDYSMLELRILAYTANVKKLIERLEAGVDLHSANEMDLFGTQGVNRVLAKNFVFASIYGGGEIAIQIALAKKGQYLEQSRILELRRKLFESYPEMPAWQVTSMMEWERARDRKQALIARNAFGTPRVMLAADPGKEGLSTKIQGTAAYIMSFNLLRLHADAPRVEELLIAQIHDSLLGLVPEERVQEVDRVMRDVMQRPVWFPNRFATLPVDAKVGQSWDDMHDLPRAS